MAHSQPTAVADTREPFLNQQRVVLGLLAVVGLLLAVRNTSSAVTFARRGLPNDHLVAVSDGFLSIALSLCSIAALLLVTGHATFLHRSPRTSLTGRFLATATIAALACLGGLLASAGAHQGTWLIAGCTTYTAARVYERRQPFQSDFALARWLIRSIAITIGLPALAGGASLLFDAANLYNKLHLHWPILNYPRMAANIPESDAMVHGLVLSGAAFSALGCLLVREAFRGFHVFRQHASEPRSNFHSQKRANGRQQPSESGTAGST